MLFLDTDSKLSVVSATKRTTKVLSPVLGSPRQETNYESSTGTTPSSKFQPLKPLKFIPIPESPYSIYEEEMRQRGHP